MKPTPRGFVIGCPRRPPAATRAPARKGPGLFHPGRAEPASPFAEDYFRFALVFTLLFGFTLTFGLAFNLTFVAFFLAGARSPLSPCPAWTIVFDLLQRAADVDDFLELALLVAADVTLVALVRLDELALPSGH